MTRMRNLATARAVKSLHPWGEKDLRCKALEIRAIREIRGFHFRL